MLTFGTPSNVADKGYVDTAVAGATSAAAQRTANLSDLAAASTARTNLGLAAVAATGSASDLTAGTVAYPRLPVGTAASTVAAGNDTRLADARPWTLYSGSAAAGQIPVWTGTGFAPQAPPATGAPNFTQSAAKTAAYTAVANEIVVADTTSGAFTITGPTSGAPFGVRWTAGTTGPTVAAPSGYTINGAATVVMNLAPSSSAGEIVRWQAFGTDYQPIDGFKPQSALDSRLARRATPTNTGVARPGLYDPVRNTYVPSTGTLSALRGTIAKAATGSLVSMVCVGDSKTAGYGPGQQNSWPTQLRTRLAALGVPSAGTGLVPAGNGGGFDTTQWTASTGTWNENNLYNVSATSGATKTFVSRDPGTVVDIWYFANSASFTYSIDSAAAVTVTPSGAQTIAKTTVTGLANTTHTVVITTSSASAVYLIGICVRQTTGLLIHNLGILGIGAGGWSNTGFGQPVTIAQALTPDITCVELGTNDAANTVPVATYATQLAAAHAALPTSARIQIVQSTRAGLSTWPAFVSAAYDQADAAGSLLFDTTDRWGSAATATTNGLLGADQLHESAAGHSDIARSLSVLLAA